MKTENAIGYIGLVAIIGLVAFYSARYDSLVMPSPINTGVVVNTAPTLTNTVVSTPGVSAAVVAGHSTAADCWIIVSGKVYNVTAYLPRHPGGAARITPFCGQDATTAFQTQGGEGTHSSVATQELQQLYLGDVAGAVVANVNTAPAVNVNTPTNSTPVQTNASASAGTTLTTATVATHSRSSDCWIIVNGSVYNVTGYLIKHPGGASRITPYCGKDATSAFATQGGTGSHSSSASADLAALRLGTLGSTTTSKVITQSNTNASTLTPGGEDDDREEEDDDD